MSLTQSDLVMARQGPVIDLHMAPLDARIVQSIFTEYLARLKLQSWQRADFRAVSYVERLLSDQCSNIDQQLGLIARPAGKADRPT